MCIPHSDAFRKLLHGVDARVAVVAEQHAPVELVTNARPATAVTAGDGEPLLALGEMVEAERFQTAVVSAELAATTFVVHHLSLELAARLARRAVRAAGVAPPPRVALPAVVLV